MRARRQQRSGVSSLSATPKARAAVSHTPQTPEPSNKSSHKRQLEAPRVEFPEDELANSPSDDEILPMAEERRISTKRARLSYGIATPPSSVARGVTSLTPALHRTALWHSSPEPPLPKFKLQRSKAKFGHDDQQTFDHDHLRGSVFDTTKHTHMNYHGPAYVKERVQSSAQLGTGMNLEISIRHIGLSDNCRVIEYPSSADPRTPVKHSLPEAGDHKNCSEQDASSQALSQSIEIEESGLAPKSLRLAHEALQKARLDVACHHVHGIGPTGLNDLLLLELRIACDKAQSYIRRVFACYNVQKVDNDPFLDVANIGTTQRHPTYFEQETELMKVQRDTALATLAETQKRAKTLQQQWHRLDVALDEKERVIVQLQAERASPLAHHDCNVKNADQEGQIAELKRTNEDQTVAISRLKHAADSYHDELSKAQKLFERIQAEHQTEVRRLSESRKNAPQIEKLEGDVAELIAERRTLRNQVDIQTRQRVDTEGEMDNLLAQIAEIDQRFKHSASQADGLKLQLAQNQSEHSNALSDLNSQLDTSRKLIRDERREATVLQEKAVLAAETHSTALNEKDREIESLRAADLSRSTREHALVDELTKLKQMHDDLTQRHAETLQQIRQVYHGAADGDLTDAVLITAEQGCALSDIVESEVVY